LIVMASAFPATRFFLKIAIFNQMAYEPGMDMRPQKIVVSAQYVMIFGIMGVFLPYFNLYCYHINFSGFQIGVISALRSLCLVVFPLIWGRIADRYCARRPIYILCTVLCAVIWAAFFRVSDFRWFLFFVAAYGIFYAPLTPFMEAFTMEILGNEKKSYGNIRVWGSISFVLLVLISGRLIDMYSVQIILSLIFAGSCLQAAMSFKMPKSTAGCIHISGGSWTKLFSGRMVILLTCGFLMLASHGTYYGFFSIHLEHLGYDNTFIGLTWALASCAEIVVMLRSVAIFRRFSIENVLLFSFIAAIFRWSALCFARGPVAILMSQVLHAATYGAFHMASILYIDALSPSEGKTFGQAANNALSYGLGMMAGFFFNGIFFERIGAANLFLISAVIAMAGAIILLIGKIRYGSTLHAD